MRGAKLATGEKLALAGVLGVLWLGTAHAGGANWNLTVHSAPRAPQVMLYIGKPVGGAVGLGAHSFFGFRVDQVRVVSNSPRADASDGLQQKELLRWQFEPGVNRRVGDMHLDFGRNVTWDVTRRAFGPKSVRETYAVSFPSLHGKDGMPAQGTVRPMTEPPRTVTLAVFAGVSRGPVVRDAAAGGYQVARERDVSGQHQVAREHDVFVQHPLAGEHDGRSLFVIRTIRRAALPSVNP